ncbi:MAG: peptide-methionine (S)-S-oxide reductase MsrA [Alteromonadaceae bacterium]|nr:peptide-methionine (S)-S-oxide reductase MsrA [Alteromonadaceae bacterium]
MQKILFILFIAVAAVFVLWLSIPAAQSTSSVAMNAQSHDASKIKQITIDTDLPMSIDSDTLVLGLGCFWGAEKRFEAMPGVINVVSGYADGRGFAPTYRNITQAKHRFNEDNYAEVIQIEYNPSQISAETLLKAFYEMHDPTQTNRQGNDIGTQYRSTILYANEAQKAIASEVTQAFQPLLTAAGYGAIQTQIKALDAFHPAEEYHQDYIAKNPNGYCPDHSTGVRFDGTAVHVAKIDNQALLLGQHIVVIDSPDCPYCDKFKADVADAYQGSIPMHFRRAEQLEGLTVKSPTWATPTLLFMQDGKEVHGVQGYVAPDKFYQLLGAFKLGDSEAFDVAFNKGTDARFCRQYEEFKNVGEGVFIDTLSGAPLFDTDYQFNSGSGWLSFTEAVKDSVTYHQDLSYGMVRNEIKAAKSGIHLGHVFDDGPDGKPRYCINATVLEFRPRAS